VGRAAKTAKNGTENGLAAKPASGFETTLWAAADKLRGNMDASEYKHVALGLIFLKYISDRFEERRAEALADPEEAELVDERDLYVGDNVFWVPEEARWDFLKVHATSVEPTIGALIDQAMLDLEAENPSLKGVLTKNYARPELDQTKLGEVIKLFSDLAFQDAHHGEDVLGRVYEYFLGQFAIAEGKRAGKFFIRPVLSCDFLSRCCNLLRDGSTILVAVRGACLSSPSASSRRITDSATMCRFSAKKAIQQRGGWRR
jgi:type I restriction enzyme M protein